LEKQLRTPKSVRSTEKATEADAVETNFLVQTFLAGKYYLYETHRDPSSSNIDIDKTELEEIYEREQALSELKDIIKNWIVSVAKQTGMEENLAKEEEAKIFTFGSHRLGVNSRGGDIDTLVLCPIYVDRDEHFFKQLYSSLEKESHVEGLFKVNDPKALVPVIKMTFHDIPVDLAFAKLDIPKIDKKLKHLNDTNLLAATIDDKMVYSMNGPRNVDMIIQSIDSKEDSTRIANFRATLKLLKLWAKNRGIYSNAMGYVTGISLAILVAKVCQLFPNLKPNKLIQKFFFFYSMWNWDDFPVFIDEIRTYDNLERFNDMQWYDPKSEIGLEKIALRKKDEYTSPMMVITPAFPVMNATKKVCKTNLDVMKDQFATAKGIVQKKPIDWKKLFSRIDFFNEYYNFIEVSCSGTKKTNLTDGEDW
jgi:poly(A) polymerase